MGEPGADDGESATRPATGAVGAVVGLILAVVVAGPWVGHGQVLLLDWVSGPYPGPGGSLVGAEGNTLGGAPFVLLLRALRSVFGASWSNWLPLVAWMPLVGWGVGRLTRRAGWPAAASAAALACYNPFTLDRLAVGQINVLWGYALLPLAALTLLSDPSRRLAWAARVGLVGAALTAVSPHFFAYWLVLVVASVAVLPMVRRRATGSLVAVLGALAASAYLLVVRQPSITVDQADLSAYRTRVAPPGLTVTILSLRGFWRQSNLVPSRSPASWALVILLGAGVLLGIAAAWRRREVLAIGGAGLVGGVLAAGDQGLFGGLYRFAFEHVGPFRILREPQKASALLAIALSVFFGFGVARLVALLAGRWVRIAGAVVLAGVPLGTAPALPAFGSTVDAVRPSADWREADSLVGSGPAGVLALPWHLYLSYPSTGSPVANLAPTRFRAPVVSGDNVELPGLATTSTRQRSRYLEDRFRRGPVTTDFGAQIEPAGLGWVLLVKTVDWTAYGWLDQQQDLVRVLDTPELALYRSTAPSTLSPASASREGVAGWRVRSPEGRAVPLPEVADGAWTADRGRVEITVAGAPAIIAEDTSVRSKRVQQSVAALALSSGAAAVLALVALSGVRRPFQPDRRRAAEAGDPAPSGAPHGTLDAGVAVDTPDRRGGSLPD